MNWINVEEKMPAKGQRVLAYSPQLGVLSAVLHLNIEGKWKYTGVDMPVHESNVITHWMILPPPPFVLDTERYYSEQLELSGS